MTTDRRPLDLTEGFMPKQVVKVNDHDTRAFRPYVDGEKPYIDNDTLSQKLWSVVNAELGPSAADVLTKKLEQAVVVHVTKGGVRR